MSFEFKSAARTTLGALAVAAMAVAGAAAPAFAQNAPQGWFKVCDKDGENEVCSVRNIRTAETGGPQPQLITAVALITVTGKVNRKFMQVSVPTARLIPPGVLMQIDGSKGQKIDYGVCMPELCIAELPLTDGIIANLKKGNEVVFTSVNFQRMPNPIKFSLEGFTGTFDGKPIEKSAIEEQQRELQAKEQKIREMGLKKLQDAQDNAKNAQ
ncbi:invasion associated locus B family protein [Rhizobium alvei]|uniref:Invasion associated locus B family protein n=1 Tax=Rhizobium alvei TaxID=1132659 RepID=A0ABT8YKT9_9HYPH|nr:invasion associated locus B family protein [Rhizobium alvei]MDO6964131.1 invasion associated locus B family protein [Rhizobium alvei]